MRQLTGTNQSYMGMNVPESERWGVWYHLIWTDVPFIPIARIPPFLSFASLLWTKTKIPCIRSSINWGYCSAVASLSSVVTKCCNSWAYLVRTSSFLLFKPRRMCWSLCCSIVNVQYAPNYSNFWSLLLKQHTTHESHKLQAEPGTIDWGRTKGPCQVSTKPKDQWMPLFWMLLGQQFCLRG